MLVQIVFQIAPVYILHHDIGGIMGIKKIEDGNHPWITPELSEGSCLIGKLAQTIVQFLTVLRADWANRKMVPSAGGNL